jgi:hypothetical protein
VERRPLQLPAQSALSSAFFFQKCIKKNSDLAWVGIWRVSEFKLKYDAEDIVLENKSGLWTF